MWRPPSDQCQSGWTSSYMTPRGDKSKDYSPAVPTQGKEGLFKTELCRAFLSRGVCAYGDKCSFAHGSAELKARDWGHLKYKTIECISFSTTGMCRFGTCIRRMERALHSVVQSTQNLRLTFLSVCLFVFLPFCVHLHSCRHPLPLQARRIPHSNRRQLFLAVWFRNRYIEWRHPFGQTSGNENLRMM